VFIVAALFFFFQAEDGIRDFHVTGVQTCALPILALAQWLKEEPWVRRVYYPGLPDHPGHAVHRRQARGFGGMLSFETDTPERAERLVSRTRLFTLAESLGGVESLISLPAKMTHASIPPERRAQLGITDSLVRVSVGIEDVEDLIEDLAQAC